MPVFYGAVDLSQNELRNAKVQNLASAPGSPTAGQLYYNSSQNILYWWNGTTWISAAGATMSPTVSALAVANAATAGVATQPSAGDHVHGMPGWGATVTTETGYGQASGLGSAVTLAHSDHTHGTPALTTNNPVNQAIGDVQAVGVSAFPSRDDHRHGMPGFGGSLAQQGWGQAQANGTAVTVNHSDHTHGTPALPAVNQLATTTGALNMQSFQINALADPTNPQDAATKNYVDGAINGLAWKAPCRVATTANIAQSGTMTIDGVAVVAGDRVLCKNQTTASQNGIWVVAAAAWSRAADSTTGAQIENEATYIDQGTTQAGTGWTCTTPLPITPGTTSLTYAQFSGAGTYTAGNGLTLTGNVFAVGAGTGILSTAGQVAVDTTVIATQAFVNTAITGMAKKYAGALNGSASPETITHNLNTQDIQVMVHNSASPYQFVQVDWAAPTVNTVQITYNPNLGAGWRVVVTG